jgi:alpha-tubulin suppressor-like RCC1 family protein
MVSAGGSHSAGITTTGALYAWGNNNFGQLGDGTTVAKSSPVQIGSSSWTTVSAGGGNGHTAGITTTGALFTWGLNNFGQLGDGTTVGKSSPIQIGSSSWSMVSAGSSYTAGITTTGALFTWGYNGYAQLGDGTLVNKSSPVYINYDPRWTAISSGLSHTMATVYVPSNNQNSLFANNQNSLFVWGDNTYGQLGNGTTTGASSPVLINTYKYLTRIVAGGNSTLKQ